MAQGPVKAKATAPKQAKKSKPANKSKVSKKGKRAGIENSRVTKKFTAALVGRTEKLLGERAGHLELVGKGKKTEEGERVSGKGGTKRYG